MLGNEIHNEHCGWLYVISTIVMSLICSAFSFVICTKKSNKSSAVSNVEEIELPQEPSFHERPSIHERPPFQERPSYPQAINPEEDFVKNTKKTEMIRKGLLKTTKKNPNYDTLADIDREMSLRQMDVGQKSEPVREHVYERLGSDIGLTKMAQPAVDGKTFVEFAHQIPPRRDSDPQPEVTKVGIALTKASPTEAKQPGVGDATQKFLPATKNVAKAKPSRQMLICGTTPKLVDNRRLSPETLGSPNIVGEKSVKGAPLGAKANKLAVGEKSVKGAPLGAKASKVAVGEKSVKGAPLGVKASKLIVGEKTVKNATPTPTKNMWDAIKS